VSPSRALPAVLLSALLSAGCRTAGMRSPTIDVLGSYFPAWMVCILLGLGATILVRQILVGLRLDAHLRPAGLVYVCMMVLWTMTAWLVFFNA
jgi:YtcA family